MNKNKIITDPNFREIFDYPTSSFPVIVWKDEYTTFVNNTVDFHWHNDFEFCYLLCGEVDYYMGENYIHLNQGDCLFINSNTLHRSNQCVRKNAIMLGVTFQPSILCSNKNSELYTKYFDSIIHSNLLGFQVDNKNTFGESIILNLKTLFETDNNCEGYELLCVSILSKIWYDLVNYQKSEIKSVALTSLNIKYENELKAMVSFIQKKYADDISIDDIANYVKISKSECFRCFKKLTNKTPVEYITEYRLSCAANMLKTTDCTITEICLKCGFSNSSYFCKLFKKMYKCTPLNYRKQTQ